MRTIPEALYSRITEIAQTRAGNRDPRLSAVITRHMVPLVDYAMWQKVVIPNVTPTRTSIAARRPNEATGPDYIYVGAVEDGAATIYSAAFSGTVPHSTFSVVETIADAVDIALAFEGHYVRYWEKIELVTDAVPWVFWIDSLGDLYGRLLGETGSALLASSAISVSTVMGIVAITSDPSEGLVLAYVTSAGAVYTRQYLDGVWETAAVCSEAPANVEAVALSRTWDWRVVMQLRDSGGKVWQLLGKSIIMGNANLEQFEVDMNLDADVYATVPHDTNGNESIEMAAGLETAVYSVIPPEIVSAANIDDGTGNWGLLLRVVYSGSVFSLAGNAPAFVLGGVYAGEVIAYDPADPSGKTLILTMADFNNLSSPSDLVYTPGTLINEGSVTLLESQTVSVALANLVPTAPPEPESAEALDNVTIDILFSELLSSANISANAAAFAISGYEPLYSPGSSLVPTNYVISSVGWGATNDIVRITMTAAGRLKYPQENVKINYTAASGNLKNQSGTLAVATFELVFDPDEANLDLMFNPMAYENLEVNAGMTIAVNKVTYENSATDEQIEVDVDLNISVYDTEENPV